MQNKLSEISIEEYISEGVILIDRNGTIIKYNSKAKEILGLSAYYETSHKAGRLEEGDLLLFADTSVGDDDGGLNSEILKEYGVKYEKNIRGCGLLYIGQKNSPRSVRYKIIEDSGSGAHELVSEIDGQKLSCAIDYYNKKTVISVNGSEFVLDYFLNIANAVILRNRELVFYQMKGYTARREALFDIMRCAPFKLKEGLFNMDVEGTNIYSFHAENALTIDLVNCACGKSDGYLENKLSDMNGFTVMSSIHPIDIDGERRGALLTMTDVSKLEKSQSELSAALNELEKLKGEYRQEDLFPEIIGVSVAMKEVKRLAIKAARSESNVLILGESGTGKSYIAKKIHERSKRSSFPFVEINCCAIPKELLESELFGYEKGAFTGARPEGKNGILELADGGTVFLDEIGDMPLEMQAKLLLFIQKRSFYRVGSDVETKVNVRIITATNKNIEEEILNHRFREDLFYRLNILPIDIAAIRNRREDIGPMIEHIMEKNNRESGEHKILSAKAHKLLLTYDYPGNVREMENMIERAFVLSEKEIIYPEHLLLKDRKGDGSLGLNASTLDQLMASHEKEVIMEALRINGNNHIKTFQYLGVGKTTFYSKLKKYNIK